MSSQVHGHEVIAMLLASPQAHTRDSLEAAIVGRFGPDTRFFTCSAEDMTALELIDFLDRRGKFRPVDGGFAFDPARVCSH